MGAEQRKGSTVEGLGQSGGAAPEDNSYCASCRGQCVAPHWHDPAYLGGPKFNADVLRNWDGNGVTYVKPRKHVVMFSGGIGSWATAKRVAEKHGTANLILLFSDTLMEDEDLYRFIDEAARNVGGKLVKISEGRDVWQVFFDVRFLGNTRIDPCSRVLKRELLRGWLEDNCDPENTTVYLGIDWSEEHRFSRAAKYWSPWTCEAPLCDPPFTVRDDKLTWLDLLGIAAPRLYALGFDHNNCGGFCVKAGQAQFERLLRVFPERYAYHERREQELREYLDKDIAILRDRRGGTTKPLTLKAFRERLQKDATLFDNEEWGGCSCFTPSDEEVAANVA